MITENSTPEKTETASAVGVTSPASWAAAWQESPGPRSVKAGVALGLKGFCMGAADIIPGVSGGTVAFITGIYDSLLGAITSFDTVLLSKILKGDCKAALAHAHIRFLLPLLAGIGLALLSTARLMHYLLQAHPIPTWSLFFGLIAASILFVGKKIRRWSISFPFLILGAVGAYGLVGLIPVTTPDDLWFVFVCGSIAICAMILPGISGSFILLILGKYMYVTGAVRSPFVPENALILLVFGCGCVVGITVFSRFLRFCLHHFHDPTMAVLTGFMLGAMRKIWPWKVFLQWEWVRDQWRPLQEVNVPPLSYDASFWIAIGMMVVGFVAVLLLEQVSSADETCVPVEKDLAVELTE